MLLSLFAVVVLIATIVGSISGIGGGVLIKPVMDAIFPMTTSEISFLSGTTVLTMTVVSLLRSRTEAGPEDIYIGSWRGLWRSTR